MKKIVLIFLLTISFNAMSDVIMKYGAVANNQPEDTTFGAVWLEQDNCNQCLSLFAFEFHSNDLVSNRVAGVDYTWKVLRKDSAHIRLSFGYAVAEKTINNGEQFNFHYGGGFVLKANKYFNMGLYYDHFSNGKTVLDRSHIEKNTPIEMLSLGIQF